MFASIHRSAYWEPSSKNQPVSVVLPAVASVLAAAKSGDMTAARLVLERIVPIRKGRPVAFDLPAIETPADVVKAVGALVSEVARGELTPEEAATVAGLLEMYRRTIETCEIEQRLSELEREASERK
jgi:hypothetical protein